jgi:spermidine synthase
MRLPKTISTPMLTVTTTGFAATIAQIVIIRELLVLFYGNELSAGLIFSAWLIWSGLGSGLTTKWTRRNSNHIALLRFMLVCMALVLPLSMLFIRASRIIWALPLGELPSIGKMLLISLVATSFFCLVSGALFAICWKLHRNTAKHPSMNVYLGEALGSAIGGLSFYFIFISHLSGFAAIWICCGVVLILAGWLSRPWWPVPNLGALHVTWVLTLILFLAASFFGIQLEQKSRRWQWGSNLVSIHDTAYQNIAALKKDGQISIFTNGLWSFSEPDLLSAEHSTHLALLQHPQPKTVLVLGGGIAGILNEILKHPHIQSVHYVEPDPDFIRIAQPHLSSAMAASLQNTRVQLVHLDPRTFLQRSNMNYDVILLRMGDPITTQMNRFYTQEFFAHVKQCLSPGGVFSFAVSGGESMLGPTQAQFVGSLRLTLFQIFQRIMIYPGEQIRFFATDLSHTLVADPDILTQRITKRNLKLTYIREDILQDALNPMRLDYMEAVLKEAVGAAINRDFSPICYFHTLSMWATQWHKHLQKIFNSLAQLKSYWFWTIWICSSVLIVIFFWSGRPKFRLAVAGSIFISGAIEIVFQVILLVSFQIIQGFMYRQLALIIAFFMTGLAVGAGWVARYRPANAAAHVAWKRLLRIQTLMCILPLVLIICLNLFHTDLQNRLPPSVILWLFTGLSLLTGILGGLHFALATMVMIHAGVVFEKIGGYFYALDVAGAALGALMTSLFILPIYGIMNTLILLSLLASVSLLLLLRRA